MSSQAKLYISGVVGAAICLAMWSLFSLHIADGPKLAGFVLVALLASTFKVRIPDLDGHYSLNFLVLFASLWKISTGEIMLMAGLCGVTQSCWRAVRRPQLVQVAFNASNVVISMAIASVLFHLFGRFPEPWLILACGVAAAGYYIANGGLTSVVICLVQGGGPKQIWQQWNFYVLPYSLLGSTLAAGSMLLRGQSQPAAILVAVLVLYLLFRIVRRSFAQDLWRLHPK